MYEIFAKLLQEKGLKAADVTRATGIKSPVFSEWKKGKSRPNTEKLIKIADFLGVSVEYLITGKEKAEEKETTLTAKDQRDIAIKIDKILGEIDSDDSLMFDSGEIDDETREYLKNSLSLALTNAKIMAKEKYTPKKYRKTEEK
ncbi:helix-turn-helix domain-containing protein [Lachnospiraceae bacterium LCP19S3_B12]